MNHKKVVLFFATIFIITILSVACSKAEVTNAPVETLGVPQETQPIVRPTAAPTKEPTGVPDDVPIMPDAYDLQISTSKNLIYKVNAQLKDVVAFYEEELTNSGWDAAKHPESVVGSMAQISRTKANGDYITFSIQYNPVAEFTIVQIFITRAP